MQLEELFKVQKVLRDRINYNEPDRFNKLVLALLVELGECANEWRGFKFWSQNQDPRTKAVRNVAMMEEDKEYYNPLLEEYVDGLHFVLELGIELNREYPAVNISKKEKTVEEQFKRVFNAIICVDTTSIFYLELLEDYYSLGEMLGFTWEQIEQAYLEKNKINHQRQDVGY